MRYRHDDAGRAVLRMAWMGACATACAVLVACPIGASHEDAGHGARDAGSRDAGSRDAGGDAGEVPDAGQPPGDGGVDEDAGPGAEDGGAPDAGAGLDAGMATEGGPDVDAGASPDAGMATDGGPDVDAGAGLDAGTATDGGASVDGGVDSAACGNYLVPNATWEWRTYNDCTGQGPCWEAPKPHGVWLYDVWVESSGRPWAVGETSTVLRRAGEGWEALKGGWGEWMPPLHEIFGFSEQDVWLAGSVLFHWNGASLTCHDAYAADVWGAAPDDVWAVGGTRVSHYDGAQWTTVELGTHPLRAIAGSASDDVWAVGDEQTFFHWDGQAWTAAAASPSPFPARYDVLDVTVSPQGRAYAATTTGLFELVGGVWQPVAGVLGRYDSIWASSDGQVWAASYERRAHFDGASWHVETTEPPDAYTTSFWSHLTPIALAGTGASQVWLVQDSGVVESWDGQAWVSHTEGPKGRITSVQIAPGGTVWAARFEQGALRATPGHVEELLVPRLDLEAGVTYGGELWAYGDSPLTLHYDGTRWHTAPPLPASPDDMELDGQGIPWVVGPEGLLAKWSGSSWTALAHGLTESFTGVAPLADDDVWVLGRDFVAHWDGVSMTRHDLQDASAPALGAIWAIAPDDVWVGGAGLWHYDGVSWQPQSWSAGPITSIWGSGADDVWLAAGDVHRWDGATLQAVPISAAADELDRREVRGDGVGNVWLGAARFDGTSFVIDESLPGPRDQIHAVRGHTDIWAFGTAGVTSRILRHDGAAWREMGPPHPRWTVQVAAVSHDEARFLSSSGSLYRWSTNGWERLHTGLDELMSKATTSPTGAFTGVGWAGYVVQETDAGFVRRDLPDATDLYAVWTGAGSEIWAAGPGTVAHFDGQAWELERALPDGTPTAITSDGQGRVYVATAAPSVVISNEHGTWAPLPDLPFYDVRQLHLHNGELLMVGWGTRGLGVARWRQGAWLREDPELPVYPLASAIDGNGQLWVGGREGALVRIPLSE